MIYLATPYTHEDAEVRQKRFEDACEAYAILASLNTVVLCPILMSHPVAVKYHFPGDWETWKAIDLAYIIKCRHMYILTLDGWEDSVGVTAEAEEARRLGIPVHTYSLEDLRQKYIAIRGTNLLEKK